MSSDLMETSPGGEGDQYEDSIQTVTKPHSKESGQLDAGGTQADDMPSQQEQEKSKRGNKTAENTRYGEAISEHGFGGETTTSSGGANQDGPGNTSAKIEGEAAQSREEQGYGGGSGVGA